MSILKRNGIRGDTPHLLYGNLFQMKGLSMVERQYKLIEIYGKIVGYYIGAKPTILVAETELAKRILITDFYNFTKRSIFFSYIFPSPKSSGLIGNLMGNRWRLTRNLISPSFSAFKLKAMTPILDESIESFLKQMQIKSEAEEEFNIYSIYQRLTLQMIMKFGFGAQIERQNKNFQNIFIEKSQEFLEYKVNRSINLLFMCFPELENVIQFLRGIYHLIYDWLEITPMGYLMKICTQIIELRKCNSNFISDDILQAMLISEVGEEIINNDLEINEYKRFVELNKHKLQNIKESKIHLTEDDIKINSLLILIAGYDPTSSVMAYLTHVFVNHPEIQEKVRKEVKDLYESEGKLDYNCLNNLDYMECVINETLRYYPPSLNGTSRECAADYRYKNIIIPKGATIAISTHFLHHDPDCWQEPDKFDPMRFSPERRHEIKAGSWQPFGDGPRICIAARLAYLEIKLTFAKLLLKFRLETGPHTEIGELSLKSKFLSMIPKNGVFIKAVRL